MAIHKIASKHPSTPAPSIPKNHSPAERETRSVFSLGAQVMKLQRKIGNRATTMLLSRQNNPSVRSGNKNTIQRLPSGDEIKSRSDSKSNETGFFSKGLKQGPSQYEVVIILVDQYNTLTKKSKVEGSESARKQSVAVFEKQLDKIWKEASEYIGKHEADAKRPKTIASFRTLAEEIVRERIDLVNIANNEDYNQNPPQENKVTWHQAVGMTTRSNAVRHADVIKLMSSLGLPVDFVATLDSNVLDNLVAADKALKEGNTRSVDTIFMYLSGSIPAMWPLIKSAMMRKYLGKLNPTLEKALSADYEHNDPAAEGAFSAQEKMLYEMGIENAFSNFEGKNNLGATDKEIQSEAGKKVSKDNQELKHLPGWDKQYKQRQEWEKKNVKLDDFKNLKKHEQLGLAAYSNLSDPFNKALRGDLDDMDKGQQSQILSMISALNKLPPYVGPVYRHDNIFSGFKEANQVGASTTDMAFISTTKDASSLKKIDGNAGEPEVMIVIQSKTGRFIKPISRFNNFHDGDENEVLFKPGVRFRITKRYDAKDDKSGPDNFPKDMDTELKNALDQDVKKKHIKIVLKKIEE